MNTSDKSDRELLELAAKAAGYRYRISNDWHDAGSFYVKEDDRRAFEQYWNPLADDGDALRLAIAVSMTMVEGLSILLPDKLDPWVVVRDFGSRVREKDGTDGDPYAATRRAIVLAAAALAEAA